MNDNYLAACLKKRAGLKPAPTKKDYYTIE